MLPPAPPSALAACVAALAAAGRNARRARIRGLGQLYDRERALRHLLPALCDRPLSPMRRLDRRWHRDDAATTRQLMRAITASVTAPLWDRAHDRDASNTREARIDALRSALCAETMRYRAQRAAEAKARAAA
jgi:hypothetical protein